MDRTERVVRIARRRLTAGAIIDGAGRGLAWGSLVALGVIGAGKLVSMPGAWWWWGLGVLVAGGAAGALLALRTGRTALDAAGEVDRRLRLKDRLASGTVFRAAGGESGAFASLAVEEADRASHGIDPKRAVPIVWGRPWRAWPWVAAAAAAVGLWVPELDLAAAARRRSEADAKAREQVARQLAKATRVAPSDPKPMERREASVPRTQDGVLREIEKELASGKLSPEQAAEKGAGELEKLAGERERIARGEDRAHDDLRETLAAMKPTKPGDNAIGDGKLANSLKDGDLDSAAQAAREMLNASPEQTAADRARAADELKRLADELRAAEAAQAAARRGKPERTTEFSVRTPAGQRTRQETSPSSGPETHAMKDDRAAEKVGDATGKRSRSDPSSADDLASAMERAAEELRREPGESRGGSRSQAAAGREQERDRRDAKRGNEATPPRTGDVSESSETKQESKPDESRSSPVGSPDGATPPRERQSPKPGEQGASARDRSPNGPHESAAKGSGDSSPSRPSEHADGVDGKPQSRPAAGETQGADGKKSSERTESAKQSMPQGTDGRPSESQPRDKAVPDGGRTPSEKRERDEKPVDGASEKQSMRDETGGQRGSAKDSSSGGPRQQGEPAATQPDKTKSQGGSEASKPRTGRNGEPSTSESAKSDSRPDTGKSGGPSGDPRPGPMDHRTSDDPAGAKSGERVTPSGDKADGKEPRSGAKQSPEGSAPGAEQTSERQDKPETGQESESAQHAQRKTTTPRPAGDSTPNTPSPNNQPGTKDTQGGMPQVGQKTPAATPEPAGSSPRSVGTEQSRGTPPSAKGEEHRASGGPGEPKPGPSEEKSPAATPSQTPNQGAGSKPSERSASRDGSTPAAKESEARGAASKDSPSQDPGSGKVGETSHGGAPSAEKPQATPNASPSSSPSTSQPDGANHPGIAPKAANPAEAGETAREPSLHEPSAGEREAMKQLADKLERYAKQPRNAQEARKQAEEMRRQAQELLKNASPEQIERAKRWAQDLARNAPPSGASPESPTESGTGSSTSDNPLARRNTGDGSLAGPRTSNRPRVPEDASPTTTETVDARPRTPGNPADRARERVIAEWYSDKKPAPGEHAISPLTPEAETTLREAVRDGEHALDVESVPTRYDKLLRRYFQRLGERAKGGSQPDPASVAPAAPAVPAQDAPSRPTPSTP